jgi:hypothetical protein
MERRLRQPLGKEFVDMIHASASTVLRRGLVWSALAVLVAAAAPQAQSPQRFTATAAALGTVATGATARVDVTINRWSTDAELEQLRTALVEKGTDALFTTLQKMKPVGNIRVNESLGWDLRYARESSQDDGGRRIVFATDRPINAWEARNQPRTIDYKFTIGELKVDAKGQGAGTLGAAVKVDYDPDDKTLVLETFSSEPVRLLQVRAVK